LCDTRRAVSIYQSNRDYTVSSSNDDVLQQIRTRRPDIIDLVDKRDSGAQLLRVLTENVAPADVATEEGDRVWELCGIRLANNQRVHEALVLFLRLYDLKLRAQETSGRIHKGSSLIWISYCFIALGFPAYAKRYTMLAKMRLKATAGYRLMAEHTFSSCGKEACTRSR